MVAGNKHMFLALKENKPGIAAVYLLLTRERREKLRKFRREAVRDDALVSRDFEFTAVALFTDKQHEELFTFPRDDSNTTSVVVEFDRRPKFISLQNVLWTRVWSSKQGASFTLTYNVDGNTERTATPNIAWSDLYITRERF